MHVNRIGNKENSLQIEGDDTKLFLAKSIDGRNWSEY